MYIISLRDVVEQAIDQTQIYKGIQVNGSACFYTVFVCVFLSV